RCQAGTVLRPSLSVRRQHAFAARQNSSTNPSVQPILHQCVTTARTGTGVAPAPAAMVGSYDARLVALSVLIATAASYAALDLAGRVTSAQGRARALWLGGG